MAQRTKRLILGDISPQTLYSLNDLAERGMSKTFQRTARRNGLRVRYYGTYGFVLGQDLIDFLMSQSSDSRESLRETASSH